jgi:hypothetical protein
MFLRIALLTLCTGLLAPAPAAAADALLWSYDIHHWGGSIGVANSLSPRFEIRDPNAPSNVALATIFAWLNLDASHSGMRFAANAATDPDWPIFNHYLTDGAPNQIRIFLRLSSGSGSGWLITAPEFPGEAITRADLLLGVVSVISPGSNPNGDGNWTDYTIDAQLQIFGAGATPVDPLSWGRLKQLYR